MGEIMLCIRNLLSNNWGEDRVGEMNKHLKAGGKFSDQNWIHTGVHCLLLFILCVYEKLH